MSKTSKKGGACVPALIHTQGRTIFDFASATAAKTHTAQMQPAQPRVAQTTKSSNSKRYTATHTIVYMEYA